MKNEFLGKWRLIEMEQWDQDFDEDVSYTRTGNAGFFQGFSHYADPGNDRRPQAVARCKHPDAT